MREVERIQKSVLTADSIETGRGWTLAQKDNPLLCSYCKSPLFYVGVTWGVVDEQPLLGIPVLGKQRKHCYGLREVGFQLYCAECGHFHEQYGKYFYPDDKLVCSWSDEELHLAELEELWYCLEQFNRRGDFTPRYQSNEMVYLKKKLLEYETAHRKKKRKKET